MAKYKTFFTDTFEYRLKKLAKKYPGIRADFRALLEEIEEQGDLGDSVPGVVKDGNKVFKKRMRNSSANKGLSGGFRVIEYLVTETNEVYLLDIYSKSDQENIRVEEIRRLIQKADLAKPNGF